MRKNTIQYIVIASLLSIIIIVGYNLSENNISNTPITLESKTNNIEVRNNTEIKNNIDKIENTNKITEIKNTEILDTDKQIVMYKTPSCGCCSWHAKAMEKEWFKVEMINVDDIDKIKNKYNIPSDKQSCHTSIAWNYFIEWHVPVEAIKKLLNEKPEIDWIGLPGMPSWTPWMPWPKYWPYNIYQSINGEFSEYITL